MSEQDANLGEFIDSSITEKEHPPSPKSRFWGDIPEGWELTEPNGVYDVNPNPKPDEKPNTYIEMDALDTDLPWPRYFGKRNAADYSGKTFTTGDTLFARITPCTENGKAALVPEMETQVGVGSTEFAVLSPNRERILPWYLFYVAKSHPVRDYAISRMRGSTGRQRVPFSVFRRELDIALPSLNEQRKLASVLYNVDQAIQKTVEIVEQTKRLKQGVVQDLFTSGLEDSNTQAVHIGEFPANWEFVKLSEVTDIERGDTPDTSNEDYYGGEKTWVTPDDLSTLYEDGDGKYISDTRRKLTEAGVGNASLRVVEPNSVMFTSRSYGIGKTAICTVPAATNQGITAFECGERLHEEFLYYYLDYIMDYIISISGVSTFPEISKSDTGNIDVPVPDIEEQKEIANILGAFDEKVAHENKTKNRFQRLKRGLMQDLLSGEVRTTDADIEIPEEVTAYG